MRGILLPFLFAGPALFAQPEPPLISFTLADRVAYLPVLQVQTNTDKNIAVAEAMADHVRAVVNKTLEHYADRLTRVEVHLGDMNAEKTGPQDHS